MLNRVESGRLSPVILTLAYLVGSLAWFLTWLLFIAEPSFTWIDFLQTEALGLFAFILASATVLLLGLRWVRRGRERGVEQLEEALRELEAVILSSPLPMLALDREGIVSLWNPAAEKLFGWTAEEARGRVFPAVPEEDRETFERLLEKHFQGEVVAGVEVKRQTKEGRLVDVQVWAAPLKDSRSRIIGCVGTLLDITEKKALEGQLRRSQKLETVGQLAGKVAHDFNNLLTGMLGFTQLALRSVDPKSSVHEDLTQVLQLEERAAVLTRQVLAFSRRQEMKPQVLDLHRLIGETMKMLERLLAGSRIQMRFRSSLPEASAKVDPVRFDQVLMNLVINARDAMPEGGRLTISTDSVVLDEKAAREIDPNARPGSYVALSVEDTGTGIQEERLARIFDPLFTTKAPDKGTGLGLSVVYGIIRQHEGFLRVTSEVGKGTRFEVFLPQAAEEEIEVTTGTSEPFLPRGNEIVLVIDDEEGVRELSLRTLEALGYTVLTAAGVQEAAREFEDRIREVALIVTDTLSPGQGSRRTLRQFFEANPRLRLLYISGYEPNEARAEKDQAQFLQKPFSPAGLARKVREVLDSIPGE